MKTILNTTTVLCILLSLNLNTNAQLKVKSDGSVKIGSASPSPSGGKLEITGINETLEARVFTGSANIARVWTVNSIYAYAFGIKSDGVGVIYKNLNSPSGIIQFNQYSTVGIGYNLEATTYPYRLYVSGSALTYYGSWVNSDVRLKNNISMVDNALSKVLRLQGKKYYYTNEPIIDTQKTPPLHYGLISQEVIEIIPELVRENNDSLKTQAINYDGFIPFLIEAIKEQQQQITEMQEKIQSLESFTSLNEIESQSSELYNFPNPVQDVTQFNLSIPDGARQASLNIFDSQGKLIKRIKIKERGNTEIIFNASKLATGIYICSLIADNKLVESSKMIVK
ncbi:MAG: tail fiber domain-containing protein [Bacteroidales bacterium]|nr:tail fiber domain-containing protein [Bacteroidales bacterium]